ncbi:hypothetical protein ACI76Z_07210 [Capnocytophaga canimorsus]|uniref:hypothetical protein n=1 Tax=Capnocytophaga canimorsus TaxID=28188 RepID=UPI003858B34A
MILKNTIFYQKKNLLFFIEKFTESIKKIKINKLILKTYFDILYSTNNEIIVSETLKQAIEVNNITGFEFSELDYEVVVG